MTHTKVQMLQCTAGAIFHRNILAKSEPFFVFYYNCHPFTSISIK